MRDSQKRDWKRVSQLSSLGLIGLIVALFDNRGGWVSPATLLAWTVTITFRKRMPQHYVPAILATATLWSALIMAVARPSLLAEDFAYYAIGAVIGVSLLIILFDRSSSYKEMASA